MKHMRIREKIGSQGWVKIELFQIITKLCYARLDKNWFIGATCQWCTWKWSVVLIIAVCMLHILHTVTCLVWWPEALAGWICYMCSLSKKTCESWSNNQMTPKRLGAAVAIKPNKTNGPSGVDCSLHLQFCSALFCGMCFSRPARFFHIVFILCFHVACKSWLLDCWISIATLYSRGSLVALRLDVLAQPGYLRRLQKMLGPRGIAACQESKSSVTEKQTHEQQL